MRRSQVAAARRHARRGAGGARAPRGVRHRRDSGRHRARGAEGRPRRGCRPMSIRPISCSTTAPSRASSRRAARSPPTSLARATLGRTAASIARRWRASSPVEVLTSRCSIRPAAMRSYIVPAAFMLILQQTLLMGVGDARRRRFERAARAPAPRAAARARPGPGASPAGTAGRGALPDRSAADLRLLGHRPQLGDLLALLLPFILSVSFLGQFVGTWFKRRETAVLLFIAISLPLFFLVGVAWPVEAIPPAAACRAASSFPAPRHRRTGAHQPDGCHAGRRPRPTGFGSGS